MVNAAKITAEIFEVNYVIYNPNTVEKTVKVLPTYLFR